MNWKKYNIWYADWILAEDGYKDDAAERQLLIEAQWYNQDLQFVNPEDFTIIGFSGQVKIINNVHYTCYIGTNNIDWNDRTRTILWIPEIII